MDVRKLLEQHDALLERVCRRVGARHNLRDEDLEDFVADVRLHLLDEGAARLQSFRARGEVDSEDGQGQLTCFIRTVAVHLAIDALRRKKGRFRPSAEAKRFGPPGIYLEELLVQGGRSLEEAVRTVLNRHPECSRAELSDLAERLPPRSQRRFEGEEPLKHIPAAELDPESQLLHREQQATRVAFTEELRRARSQLPDKDQLLLRLRYEEGFGVAQIARQLKEDARPLYRRFETLIKKLRGALEDSS